ncbi:FG-GAP repeat domain-containing protein [Streptomyces sp. NPDC059175]|uniref:FG-GAP repeat domain-containing protein n=1 Tax=unclassified Streptomyces TaxID=2593676 RepID=UPI0036CB0F5C
MGTAVVLGCAVVPRLRNAASLCACVGLGVLLLTACGPDAVPPQETRRATTLAGTAAAGALPVPHGDGSHVPADFNGDGHRDLVLDDLVKAAGARHDDDAGIGVVYGTAGGSLTPAVRQLLTARENAAAVGGTLPSAFDSAAACDLDDDGFSDLVVATDPPYDGIGRPPVPLQLLFGSPAGLTGRAVVLQIPEGARYGNEWPDHPVCGDFDGDGSEDLAVTASGGRISFLRGPFTRAGAPRAAGTPFQGGGPVLTAPAPETDVDGDGRDDLVRSARPLALGSGARGKLLLGGPDGPRRPGGTYTFEAVDTPAAPPLPPGGSTPVTEVLEYADFDGDGRPDIVTRTHRGESADAIALYPDGRSQPEVTFSTSVFLG